MTHAVIYPIIIGLMYLYVYFVVNGVWTGFQITVQKFNKMMIKAWPYCSAVMKIIHQWNVKEEFKRRQ